MRDKPCPDIPDVIFCAEASRRLVELAVGAGMLWGAQLPMLSSKAFAPMTFADQNWREPERARYMAALARFRPSMATVLDWEREEQFEDVMGWAEEAAQWVEEVIVVPKVVGGVARIPKVIEGKPVRLGYSVPSRYSATPVPVGEFGERPVHLLGGSPHAQMYFSRQMNVRSVDCNYMIGMAKRGQVWVPGYAWTASARFGPQLQELGLWQEGGPFYLAFELSCLNVVDAWRRLYLESGFWEAMRYGGPWWEGSMGQRSPRAAARGAAKQGRLVFGQPPARRGWWVQSWAVGPAPELPAIRFERAGGLLVGRGPEGVFVVRRGQEESFRRVVGTRVLVSAEAEGEWRALVAMPRRSFQRLVGVSSRTFTALRRGEMEGPARERVVRGMRVASFGQGVNERVTLVLGEGEGWRYAPGSRVLVRSEDGEAVQRLLREPASRLGLPGVAELRALFGLRYLGTE